MQKSSGGPRMRPEELKAYLKSINQVKPTTAFKSKNAQGGHKNTNEQPLAVEFKANDWKEKGNAQFKSGNYSAAINCYSVSIEAAPTCIAHSNRAMAHFKLHNYDNTVKDCTAALALDNNYVKAWLRRGAAHRELGSLDSAITDFEAALRLEPSNKSALGDRKSCIEKWIQENIKKNMSSTDLLSKTFLVPIVLGDDKDLSSEEGLLKQVSVTRLATDRQRTHQENEELIQKAVVEEIEDVEENKPPQLPEAKRGSTSTPKIKEVSILSPSLSSIPISPAPAPPQQQSAQMTPQAASFKAPKTGVDFERSWRGFKGNVEQQAVYLRQINAHQVPVLLKQVFTPSLLVDLQLTVLGPMLSALTITSQEENEKAAAAILKALPKVARFSVNILSLSASQRKELSAAWDTACRDYPDLGQFRTSYSI